MGRTQYEPRLTNMVGAMDGGMAMAMPMGIGAGTVMDKTQMLIPTATPQLTKRKGSKGIQRTSRFKKVVRDIVTAMAVGVERATDVGSATADMVTNTESLMADNPDDGKVVDFLKQ